MTEAGGILLPYLIAVSSFWAFPAIRAQAPCRAAILLGACGAVRSGPKRRTQMQPDSSRIVLLHRR